MTLKTAKKIEECLMLDKDYNIVLRDTDKKMEDPMCKGYVYASLYFYDEVQKELGKLRGMIKKIHDEVIMELGLSPDTDPTKLLLEISMRMRNAIGEDSLDALIKEFLAEKTKHLALMIDKSEQEKLDQISGAIFIELTINFFNMTLESANDLEDGVKTFKFSKEYVDKMTERQKRLISPALKMIGYQNQTRLMKFEIASDWTVKYTPERIPVPFTKQEETIKDQIKTFIQSGSN